MLPPYQPKLDHYTSAVHASRCLTFGVQGGMCPTYCVAKALLNKAVQLMAADEAFKERGVSVVSVCPGWCRWAGLLHAVNSSISHS
jgi:NAD(P)-dependent dehydrogenase (short-subunit alcohol dehydrogenase family)